jgi:hypothetical protein
MKIQYFRYTSTSDLKLTICISEAGRALKNQRQRVFAYNFAPQIGLNLLNFSLSYVLILILIHKKVSQTTA